MIAGPLGYCDVVILRQFVDSREAINARPVRSHPFERGARSSASRRHRCAWPKSMDSTSSRSPTTTTPGSMIRGTRRSCGRSSAPSRSAPTTIDVGVGVTCPTTRIHPAVLAQATATSCRLLRRPLHMGRRYWRGVERAHPGRSLAARRSAVRAAGGGDRDRCAELWTGEQVTYRGRHYTVENARIYDPPAAPVPVVVSAFGPKRPSSPAASAMGCGPAATPL